MLHTVEQAELDVRMLAQSVAGSVMVGLSYTAMEAIGLSFVQRVMAELKAVRVRVLARVIQEGGGCGASP